MGLTFEDAIKKAVKAYWRGIEPEKTNKLGDKKAKYTKKYFDKFEAEKFGEETTSAEIKKGNWS